MLARAALALLDAEGAAAHGLAGLYLEAVAERRPSELAAARAALGRAAAREAAQVETFAREAGALLDALSDLGPVVLKGPALAAAWPEPRLRPVGDLDLLVGAHELEEACARLLRRGFRRAPEEPGGRLRPPPTGVELLPPEGARVAVDLHVRPFRSVGRRLDGAALRARSVTTSVLGRRVRVLEPADALLFAYVHAAKHAVRAPKWLLDLCALAGRADEDTWRVATRRARETGTARALWSAARLAAHLAPVPAAVLDETRPPPWVAAALARVVTTEDAAAARAPARAERYALEVLLEPGLRARGRGLLGVAERILAAAVRGFSI